MNTHLKVLLLWVGVVGLAALGVHYPWVSVAVIVFGLYVLTYLILM